MATAAASTSDGHPPKTKATPAKGPQSWKRFFTWESIRPLLTPLNVAIGVFFLIIVVSGAILFMLLVNWIKTASKADTDFWIEVNSQILNACFTLGAIVVAPSRMLNLWRLTVYLSVMGSERKRQASVSKQEASESLSSIVIPERAMKLGKELQRVYQPLLIMDDEETKRSLPESVHKAALVSEPKWLALILILNGQCFFQWPITVAMWGWATDYKSRPGFMVFAFLPISFLCSTWGGVWLGILSGRVTKAQKALVDAEEAASSDGTQEVAVGQVKVETRPKAATLDSNSTMTEIAVESMEDVAPTSVPLPPAANPSVCINADAVAQQTADRLDLNTQHDEVKP